MISKLIHYLGVQVSHPVWNRDYFYLNGKVQDVREYMRENCVHTVAEDLLALALDIFSRYDNRRRMGVEVMVLTMLATPNITKWEVNIYHNVNHINKRKSSRRPLLGLSPCHGLFALVGSFLLLRDLHLLR